MLIATEKKTVSLKSHLSGVQLKALLNILTDVMTAWPEEGSLNVKFIASRGETTIVFNGGYVEALELLEKYPNLAIRLEFSGVKIAWKKIKVVLKDASKMNAPKMELEIEVESEDIAKTEKMAAAAVKYLETA